MIRIIHRWLLVILYGSATWLGHRATTWQRLLRHSLLPYAMRHCQSRWPETAKAVKHWQERLREADNPIAPINHRRPLPDDCHCPDVVHQETISTTLVNGIVKIVLKRWFDLLDILM